MSGKAFKQRDVGHNRSILVFIVDVEGINLAAHRDDGRMAGQTLGEERITEQTRMIDR
jgi:hypothetical protein